MLRCDDCQERLLDHLYGLLEAPEAASVEAHVASCTACAKSLSDAQRLSGLLARASVGSFPEAKFVAPPKELAEPSRTKSPAVTVTSAWVRWAVAASFLLTASALAGPTARDLAGFYWTKPRVTREYAAVEKAKSDRNSLADQVSAAQERSNRRLADTRKTHDEVLTNWVAEEEKVLKKLNAQPFRVAVTGPASAIPGAPNEYVVEATEKTGLLRPVTVAAKVKDGDGTFEKNVDVKLVGGKAHVLLAPGFWSGVKPASDLRLHITATDPRSGESVELAEPIRLLDPVYTSFLTTDKPMYRPGETVFFRSLTLDRTRFLPPDHDTHLRFDLYGPSGQSVPGLTLSGLAKPADAAGLLLGPDGKPVRGIGVGAFNLPSRLPGGEYTLSATELPLAVTQPTPGTLPLATRRFLVNSYTPDRLEKKLEFDAKTFGPGDSVGLSIIVQDQGKAVRGAVLNYRLEVKTATDSPQYMVPERAVFETNASGIANATFKLPKSEDLQSAVVTVTVTSNGIVETIVRPVPLATRKLGIEFFAEGGDLIAGVENRVYFRATTSLGKPADVVGWLTDGTKDICEVRTLTDGEQPGVNQGLGSFRFTPEAGKKYALRLNRPLGVLQPAAGLAPSPLASILGAAPLAARPGYALPAAKAEGVLLKVLDGVSRPGEPIAVELTSVGAEPRPVLVGAYTRGRAVAHTKAILEPGKPTKLLLDPGASKLGGVTRITVFEDASKEELGREDLRPIAERLVFRQSGESLKFSVVARAAGGQPKTGAFLPGTPVELTIAATDEEGRAKPAIIWAAVVNKSVIAMADEKTARSLPTHFLLGGEVRHSDDLEHADFLLTDHPKAGTSLDLLLGTQGWRRFAEQAPEQFRNSVSSEEAEQFFIGMGQRTAMPRGIRSSAQKLFDEYWPKYEAAVLGLDAAEDDHRTGASAQDLRSELAMADQRHAAKLRDFGEAVAEFEVFDKAIETRYLWLPLTLMFAFGLCAGFLILRRTRPVGAPERKTLAAAALGFAIIGVLVLGVTLTTRVGNDTRWRALAATAPRPQKDPYGTSRGRVQPVPVQNPQLLPIVPGFRPAPTGPVNQEFAGPPEWNQKTKMGGDAARLASANSPKAPTARPESPAFVETDKVPFQVRMTRQPMPQTRNQAYDRLRVEAGREYARDRNAPQAKVLASLGKLVPNAKPLAVREYAHQRNGASAAVRSDFTETLLWQPVVVLPQDGKASLKFDLSDSVSGYQVLVAGHTLDGRLGSSLTTIEVRKAFAADPKLPLEVSSTDKIDLPVMLTNGSDKATNAKVAFASPGLLADATTDQWTVELPANRTTRTHLRLTPAIAEGTVPVLISAQSEEGSTDAIERKLKIVPDGFPVSGASAEALEGRTTARLNLPKGWIPGTLHAGITVYPNTLSEIQGGLDGLLREPSGCFEQSSTANYPNVLASEYMRETDSFRPEIANRSNQLMDRGYAKLTAFECPSSKANSRIGYEWFGAANKPHEALTAYGLMQFTDMARVYAVDSEMLKRTKQFLLDSRDGAGGFRRSSASVDSFGKAPPAITDAYIVWAITESEKHSRESSDLAKEIDSLLERAKKDPESKDPYYLSLVANALLNRGRTKDGVALLQRLAAMQAKEGNVPGATTSITRSSGKALAIETTALAVLGWLKANRAQEFTLSIASAMNWIGSQRDGGGSFGSTQSTILALKALVEHARGTKRTVETGTIRVSVGGREVAKVDFYNAASGPLTIAFPDPEKAMKPGSNEILIETSAKQTYPVAVAWSCRTLQPNSAPECAVKLETKLDRTEVTEGESVRLDVKVSNLADRDQGMAIAVVGIPAGLKLPEDMKQLKALMDGSDSALAYFELNGRELVLYWRAMAPNQTLSLGIQLIAEVPGEYRGPASRAYLYYGAEHKHWTEPLAVAVRQPR